MGGDESPYPTLARHPTAISAQHLGGSIGSDGWHDGTKSDWARESAARAAGEWQSRTCAASRRRTDDKSGRRASASTAPSGAGGKSTRNPSKIGGSRRLWTSCPQGAIECCVWCLSSTTSDLVFYDKLVATNGGTHYTLVLKIARTATEEEYVQIVVIPPTSNTAERLFSMARATCGVN